LFHSSSFESFESFEPFDGLRPPDSLRILSACAVNAGDAAVSPVDTAHLRRAWTAI